MDANQERNLGILLGVISLSLGIKKYILNKKSNPPSTEESTQPPTTLSSTSTIPPAVGEGMFLSNAEIENIKNNRINTFPWKKAYLDLEIDANTFIDPNNPVTPPFVSGNCFKLLTNDDTDYQKARIARNAGILALMYRLTNNITYADKARDFINTWYQNMNPTCLIVGDINAGVRIATTFPAMFYGADLLLTSNYTGWTSIDKTGFKNWVKNLILNGKIKPDNNSIIPLTIFNDTWTRSHTLDSTVQNIENWRVLLVASAGALLRRFNDNEADSFLEKAYRRYIALIPYQIDSSPLGRMKTEYTRVGSPDPESKPEGGLSYSMYAINAMIQTAEICRHNPTSSFQSNSLYDYQLADGSGLKAALKYIVSSENGGSRIKGHPYWPYGPCPSVACFEGGTCNGTTITECAKGTNSSIYELAYNYWPSEPLFKQAICDICTRPLSSNNECRSDSNGRSMLNGRNISYVTLTHGRSFTC